MPFFKMSLKGMEWKVYHSVFLFFLTVLLFIFIDIKMSGWALTFSLIVITPGILLIGLIDKFQPKSRPAAWLLDFLRYNPWMWSITAWLFLVSVAFISSENGKGANLALMALAFFAALLNLYNESNIEKRDC